MTYQMAVATLKRDGASAGTLQWDSGHGFTSEAYWCASRKRIILTCITPEGFRILSS